jgi:heme/copper-type cytochrome/quinol oxidase subunit 4
LSVLIGVYRQLSDRLGLTLTLLLTVVAFKLVANSFLPATTYPTLMDRYIIAAFLLLGTGAWRGD